MKEIQKKQIIMHFDMDAFYAAVEIRDNPELKGKPVIIGPNPKAGELRGVVSTCSYEARVFGVHSAMPISKAYQKCPEGIYIHGNMKKYKAVSDEIFTIIKQFSPIIEPLSLDEAFVDITDSILLFKSKEAIGRSVKQKIHSELGLTCSVGIASLKYISKMASEFQKPNGLTIVEDDNIRSFIDQHKLSNLWGLGKKNLERLNHLGFHSVADLRKLSKIEMESQFKKLGQHLYNIIWGIDNRGVEPFHIRKSMSRETTFLEDTNDIEFIKEELLRLSEQLAYQLRSEGFQGNVVQLKLRKQGFETFNKQVSLKKVIKHHKELYEISLKLLKAFFPFGKPIRLIGISVTKSKMNFEQLDLFDNDPKQDSLNRVKDLLNEKFGKGTIKGAGL
jgi:DNA polymerase IV